MKFVKSVMVMGLLDLTDLVIKILILPTYVMHVVDLGIQVNIMNEEKLLILCVENPGYAAARLQSHYGYTMAQLQLIKNRASLLQTGK